MPLHCYLWKKLYCPTVAHCTWKPVLVLLVVLDCRFFLVWVASRKGGDGQPRGALLVLDTVSTLPSG